MDLLFKISSQPPVNWKDYLLVAGYKTNKSILEDGLFYNETAFLFTGLTDRLISINRVIVFAKRNKIKNIKLKWIVNDNCLIPCPPEIAEDLEPYIFIQNDYSKPKEIFWLDWKENSATNNCMELLNSGKILLGQPLEKQKLSIEDDIKPFFDKIRRKLNIQNYNNTLSIHIRGGDWSYVEKNESLDINIKSIIDIADGRLINIYSDENKIANYLSSQIKKYNEKCVLKTSENLQTFQKSVFKDFISLALSETIILGRKNKSKYAKIAAYLGNVPNFYISYKNKYVSFDPRITLLWYSNMIIPNEEKYLQIKYKYYEI